MSGTGRTEPLSGFAGADRRRGPRHADLARVFWGGLAAIVLVTISLAPLRLAPGRASDVEGVLDTVAAVAAVAVFALCWARWRLVGTSAPLWAGASTLAYGLAAVAGPGVIGPLMLGRPAGGHSSLADAGLVVAVLALAAGSFSAPVDTRVRPGRVVAATVAGVAVLAGLFRLVALPEPRGVMAVGWLALAIRFAARALRQRWWEGWCAVLAVSLFVAQVASGVTASGASAAGLLAAVVGCAVELGHGYLDQRARLFDSELTLETAAVEERLEAASERSRRHAVRNAVVAVEGAAVTLERHVDRLSADDRASLTRVLSTGVERLQRLVGEDSRSPAEVDLASLAQGVVDGLGWADRVQVTVPTGLVGAGSPTHTAEVLRLLLDNADRRAPDQQVGLEGGRDGEWVVLRVRDRGTGLSRQGRRSIASEDIGFLVAGRLMHDQGGDVWVEADPGSGGGGSFALCLPAVVPPAAAGEQVRARA